MPIKQEKRLFLFSVVILFLLMSGAVFGKTTLLEKVKEKFEKEKSFAVEIVLSGGRQKGKIYFQSPEFEKIYFGDYAIAVVSDTIWNFNKKIKRLVIQEKDEDFSPFSIYDILFKLPGECKYIENKGKGEFTLIPNDEDALNVKSVKVKVNKSSLPVFVEVTDLNGKKFSFYLKNYSFGSGYDRSFFNIELPKGTKIVDLR